MPESDNRNRRPTVSVSIRPATLEDRDRIALFNMALARETEGRDLDRKTVRAGIEAQVKDPARGRYFLAESEDGEVIGQIAVTTEWSDWRNGEVWWVQNVYISRAHRREGVYRALHAYVRELALRQKAVGLRLYVDRDNEAAQRTYASLAMLPSHYRIYEEMWA